MRTASVGFDPSSSVTSPEKKTARSMVCRSLDIWALAPAATNSTTTIPDAWKSITPLYRLFNYAPPRLIWIGISRMNDADLVIGEKAVASGQLHFGHMATDALGGGDRTRFQLYAARDGRLPMARQTVVVVAGVVAHQIGVRIVAGSAANPPVITQETL